MWRVLNNLGAVVLQEVWDCNCSNSAVQGKSVETWIGFTSFSGVRHNLRLPQKKNLSQMVQLFLSKHGQEKGSKQNKKVYFLLMLPSICGQLRGCSTSSHTRTHMEGDSHLLKCCLSPRQREKESVAEHAGSWVPSKRALQPTFYCQSTSHSHTKHLRSRNLTCANRKRARNSGQLCHS